MVLVKMEQEQNAQRAYFKSLIVGDTIDFEIAFQLSQIADALKDLNDQVNLLNSFVEDIKDSQ